MGKSFKDSLNPALQFISTSGPSAARSAVPGPARAVPVYAETRSRRLQLLVKPSTYERLAARAASERVSVNEMINLLLENQI